MMRKWRYKENSDRKKIHPKIHLNIHQKNHHDQQKSPNKSLSVSQSSKTVQPCQTLPNRPVLCPSHRWHPSFIIFVCHAPVKLVLYFLTRRMSASFSRGGKRSVRKLGIPMPRNVSNCQLTAPKTLAS